MDGVMDFIKSFPLYDEFFREWSSPQDWEDYSMPFFQRNHTALAVIAALYLPMTFLGKYWMEKRPAFDLLIPLRLWNLFMTVFSGLGMYFTAPILYVLLSGQVSLNEFICDADRLMSLPSANIAAHWIWLFNVSKIVEFTDTAFIILRKKPLIFLHYYHHIITFLFCWYAHLNTHLFNCMGYSFATMNYSVHFIMYGYYFLRSMGYKPPVDFAITIAQIAQMVFGVVVLVNGFKCPKVNMTLEIFGLTIYASFFYLFCVIFKKRYIDAKPTKGAGQGGKKGGKKKNGAKKND